MTTMLPDAAREAIIRERLRLHPRHRCQCDACALSRRLDEALTERDKLSAALREAIETIGIPIDQMRPEWLAPVWQRCRAILAAAEG
jgi:hypothetical protein